MIDNKLTIRGGNKPTISIPVDLVTYLRIVMAGKNADNYELNFGKKLRISALNSGFGFLIKNVLWDCEQKY